MSTIRGRGYNVDQVQAALKEKESIPGYFYSQDPEFWELLEYLFESDMDSVSFDPYLSVFPEEEAA